MPFKRGSRVFYFRNDGLQNQSVLYWYDEKEQDSKAAPAAAAVCLSLLHPHPLHPLLSFVCGGMCMQADSKSVGPAREAAKKNVKVLLDPNVRRAPVT